MKKSDGLLIPFVLLLALGTGCDGASRTASSGSAVSAELPVDSVFPIEEEVRRFIATLDEHPDRLTGGADSRDALVRRFVEALQAEDAEALRALALSRAEFAHLYYPFTHYTRPPYELSPALVWFQQENHGGRGLERALRRYGGDRLAFLGYRCEDPPSDDGGMRIWSGCLIERRTGEEGIEAVQMLGPILERDGRFKFLSFANRL